MTSPDPIQLVVLDLMGTLVHDDGLIVRAYDRALEQTGLSPRSPASLDARIAIEAQRGRPTLDVLTEVLDDPVRAEEATWAFDDTILEHVGALQPISGARDTLIALRERGIRLAVSTSLSAEVRTAILSELGWSETFDAALSAHGDRRGHPSPDLLLEAMLDLRVDSVRQMACVGDTVADLEAGNNAGAGLVIGVLTGTHGREQLSTAPHTHLVDSVAAVPDVLDDPRTSGHRRVVDRR